mmetsp:Transcript_7828/g.28594  ORF Transcript_7828/g.28594 Transcript_7828/m.28594 type:complete len:586 (-) Transcript_7828:152-1909(-)
MRSSRRAVVRTPSGWRVRLSSPPRLASRVDFLVVVCRLVQRVVVLVSEPLVRASARVPSLPLPRALAMQRVSSQDERDADAEQRAREEDDHGRDAVARAVVVVPTRAVRPLPRPGPAPRADSAVRTRARVSDERRRVHGRESLRGDVALGLAVSTPGPRRRVRRLPQLVHAVRRHARGPSPLPTRVRGVQNLQTPRAEGALPERAPRRLRLGPRLPVRTLVVAAVADGEVHGAARVLLPVPHRARPLVRVHVPVQDDVHAGVVQERLELLLRAERFLVVPRVRAVPRDVEHHDHPRRQRAIDRREVTLQPLEHRRVRPVEPPGRHRRVAVQPDHVSDPDVVREPVLGRAAAGEVRRRISRAKRRRLHAVERHVVVPGDDEHRDFGHQRLREPTERVPPRRESVRVGQVPGVQQRVRFHLRQMFEHPAGDLRLAGVADDAEDDAAPARGRRRGLVLSVPRARDVRGGDRGGRHLKRPTAGRFIPRESVRHRLAADEAAARRLAHVRDVNHRRRVLRVRVVVRQAQRLPVRRGLEPIGRDDVVRPANHFIIRRVARRPRRRVRERDEIFHPHRVLRAQHRVDVVRLA